MLMLSNSRDTVARIGKRVRTMKKLQTDNKRMCDIHAKNIHGQLLLQ